PDEQYNSAGNRAVPSILLDCTCVRPSVFRNILTAIVPMNRSWMEQKCWGQANAFGSTVAVICMWAILFEDHRPCSLRVCCRQRCEHRGAKVRKDTQSIIICGFANLNGSINDVIKPREGNEGLFDHTHADAELSAAQDGSADAAAVILYPAEELRCTRPYCF
ncbi:hypothetical protein Bbelb_060670, partial [Branchiostoma belcheri]